MGSQFGTLFSIATFGESHGGALGVVIEGCPPGIELNVDRIQQELDRRRPGQSSLTSPRKEADQCEILSGVFEGKTLGSPIAIIVKNSDADPNAYKDFKEQYRPSHADYTTQKKYGIRAWAGGGRASARETVARVAAGAVARQVLESLGPVEVIAWVDRLEDIQSHVSENTVQRKDVDQNDVRCPDHDAGEKMEARIKQVRAAGDTVGGVIRCIARHVPAGLGDPVFDKLEADLAKAMLSLPASKGFEIGSGFSGTTLLGSEHNDVFITDESGEVRTRTNRSGGIQGGISNGMPIHCAVAFKPVSTIFQAQETVNEQGEKTTIHPKGRHDPCVLPRAVPIVEAMMCLVLVDHWLRWRGQVGE